MITIFARGVRTFQDRAKQNKFQVRIVIATCGTVGLAEWIIDKHMSGDFQIQEELDDIFGDDLDRAMTSEDLTRMKYLESCIKESLRLYPSVPFISRQLTEDVMIEVLH